MQNFTKNFHSISYIKEAGLIRHYQELIFFYYHKIMKIVSKKFGWSYSEKNR